MKKTIKIFRATALLLLTAMLSIGFIGCKDPFTGKLGKLKKITVIFFAQGGKFADGKGLMYITVKEGERLKAPNVTREGYTFRLWDDVYGVEHIFPITVNQNLELWAEWKLNSYTVHFDGNGANSGSMSDQNFNYNESKNLSKNKFEKNRYEFRGWATSKNGSKEYSDEERVSNLTGENNKTITLYAVWSEEQYTVSFDSYGGSSVDAKSANYGDAVQEPAEPTKTGYTFIEWRNEKNKKQIFPIIVSDTTIKNIRLTAKWKANTYKIHFDGNGSDSGSMADQRFDYDESKKLNRYMFIKNEYEFKGWSTSKNGSVEYEDNASVSNLTSENNKTITLYAVWGIKQYTVSFDSKDGSSVVFKKVDSGAQVQEPAKPWKEGYTFIEWRNENGEKQNFPITVTKDIKLTAHWEVNTYKVIFNGNGQDAGSMDDQVFTYGVRQNLTPNLYRRNGYHFKGWARFRHGPVEYANEARVYNLTTENYIMLYAVWE